MLTILIHEFPNTERRTDPDKLTQFRAASIIEVYEHVPKPTLKYFEWDVICFINNFDKHGNNKIDWFLLEMDQ